MPAPAAVLNILLTANTTQANAALAKTDANLKATGASATRAGSAFNTAFGKAAATGTLIAFGAIVTQSVKKSAEFEKQMTLIQTQAGASAGEVKKMGAALLEMSKSGSEFDPIELAKGLYRVESAGYRGTRALNVLKTAAEFAAVGQADLEETTFALTGTMKTGIKGAEDLAKTAGTLNAVIGQGSMRMSDLNAAIGTGFFSNAKQMGLSLQQAGAALAALTRQGQPAAQGASRLSMAFRMLGVPTDKAKEAMKGIGLEWFKLSKMMQAGNFPAAVHELVQHLNALGDNPAGKAKAAAVIREIFGARSATGINTIIQGLKDYDAILLKTNKDQKKFGEDVKKQRSTLSSQWDQLKSKLQAYEIEIGDKARPVITEALKQINQGMEGKGIAGVAFRLGSSAVKGLFKQMTQLPSAGLSVVKAFSGMTHGGNLFHKALTGVNEVAKKLIGIDFGAVPRKIKDAWGGLKNIMTHPFSSALDLITGFINDIIDVINVLPGVNIGHVGGGGGKPPATSADVGATPKGHAHGRATAKHKRATGGLAGVVPGAGIGDKVLMQAMVEPNEGIFVMNKNAMGALQAVNSAIPRFQVGGAASSAAGLVTGAFSGGGMPKLPGVGNLPEWIQPVGKFVLAKIGGYIKDKLTGYFSGGPGGTVIMDGKPVAPWIAQILQRARASGVGFNVTSGYRTFAEQLGLQGHAGPVAPAGTSHHESLQYPGGAVDISPGALALAAWLGTKKGQRINMGRLVYAGAKDPVHFSHPYGGGYQRGGQIFGSRLNIDQLTTLAKYVGMGNPALMGAIAMAESSGIPTRRGGAGEYGLWQILPSTADAFGIPKGNLLDPIKNARGAAKILKGQGLRAWTTYTSGAYKSYLGGHVKPGLLARLRGQTGTTGNTSATTNGATSGLTFKGQGIPGGMALSPSNESAKANYELLQEILGGFETTRGSMQELISQANLEALQRYQVGMAQNPLLGIPTPGMPTPTSTNLPSAMELYLRSLGVPIPPGATFSSPSSSSTAINPTGGTTHNTHVHVYIDGKELKSGIQKVTKRQSRRGNRPLPGARGR